MESIWFFHQLSLQTQLMKRIIPLCIKKIPGSASGTSGRTTSGFSTSLGASGSCFSRASCRRASNSSSTSSSLASVRNPPLIRASISCKKIKFRSSFQKCPEAQSKHVLFFQRGPSSALVASRTVGRKCGCDLKVFGKDFRQYASIMLWWKKNNISSCKLIVMRKKTKTS